MIHTFIEGILLGLTVCFLVGPAFFALLQTSIHRGFNSGVLLSIGIIISDFTLVALNYLGAMQIMNNTNNKLVIGIIGGIILVIFGVFTYTRKVIIESEEKEDVQNKTPKPIIYVLKGYFMNIANPFIFIFWMGAMGIVSSNYGITTNAIIIFFSGTLITIFATDIIKCFIANKIKQYLKQKILQLINHIIGIILVISGIVLIIRVIYYF